MFGLILVMFMIGIVVNIIGLCIFSTDYQGSRIEKLIKKMNREGLNLVDIIVISVTCVAHLILYIYYIVVINHRSMIYDFFHKPRIKKGDY